MVADSKSASSLRDLPLLPFNFQSNHLKITSVIYLFTIFRLGVVLQERLRNLNLAQSRAGQTTARETILCGPRVVTEMQTPTVNQNLFLLFESVRFSVSIFFFKCGPPCEKLAHSWPNLPKCLENTAYPAQSITQKRSAYTNINERDPFFGEAINKKIVKKRRASCNRGKLGKISRHFQAFEIFIEKITN